MVTVAKKLYSKCWSLEKQNFHDSKKVKSASVPKKIASKVWLAMEKVKVESLFAMDLFTNPSFFPQDSTSPKTSTFLIDS